MHTHAIRRTRVAFAVAVAAIAAALGAPLSPALAAGGNFTQILCANPDTGNGVMAQNGKFPDGVSMSIDHLNMAGLEGYQSCGGGQITPNRGMYMGFLGGYDISPNDRGVMFRYNAPSGLRFAGARVWRYANINSGSKTYVAGISTDPSDWMYAPSYAERCETWNHNCTTLGTSAPFSSSVAFNAGSQLNGFKWFIKCSHPYGYACSTTNDLQFRVFGAKVTLNDDTPPAVSGTPAGELASEPVIAGEAELTINGTDTGAGLYRAIVQIDGADTFTQVLDTNDGRCADANPANSDPHEFVVGKPCRSGAGGTYPIDVSKLAEGTHSVKVLLEDAGGNRTTVLNRPSVTVDNVPTPTATKNPAISGTPKVGVALTSSVGTWSGAIETAESTPHFEWQACDAAANCSPVGEDKNTYTPTPDQVGQHMRVVVSRVNSAGETGTARSAMTGTVAAAENPTVSCPTCTPGKDGQDGKDGSTNDTTSSTSSANDSSTNRSSDTNTTAANAASSEYAGPPNNGQNASRQARLTVAFAGTAKRDLKVRYGRRTVVQGKVVDENGQPVSDAQVLVLARHQAAGARDAHTGTVTTTATGAFEYAVPAGPSRILTFAYKANLGDTKLTDQATLGLAVPAALTLSGATRSKVGGRMVLKGKLKYLGRAGVEVKIQGLDGRRWRTIGDVKTRAGGRFSWAYRFKNSRSAGRTYKFRAVVSSPIYPFAAGSSPAKKVLVRR